MTGAGGRLEARDARFGKTGAGNSVTTVTGVASGTAGEIYTAHPARSRGPCKRRELQHLRRLARFMLLIIDPLEAREGLE